MPRRKVPVTAKPDVAPVPTGAGKLLPMTGESVRVALPQWEYFTMSSLDGVFFPDGMGAQGWELVTIYPVGDAMHAPIYYAVFKRRADV